MSLILLFMSLELRWGFSAHINRCLDNKFLEIAVPVSALPSVNGLYRWENTGVSLPACRRHRTPYE